MKSVLTLLICFIPWWCQAHPGNGIVVLASGVVLVADSTNNHIWRFAVGQKPVAVVSRIHAHYLVKGLDGKLYTEALQERGGAWATAIFQLNEQGGSPQSLAYTQNLPASVFAVDEQGAIIIPDKDGFSAISTDGKRRQLSAFSKQVDLTIDTETLQAMALGKDGTIYFADGKHIRQVHRNGAIETLFTLQPEEGGSFFPPGSGKTRAWSLSLDTSGKLLAAIPALRQVVSFADEKPKVIHQSEKGWIATGAATHLNEIYVVEVGMEKNDNQIRVLRLKKNGQATLIGKAP